jgi:quinohemoprotein ethanol dehydrogenase
MLRIAYTLPLLLTSLLLASAQASEPSADALMQLPTNSWLTNGGNLYNQRYSPLTQITTKNVSKLKGVWRARLNGSGVGPPFSGEAQPIVHDGVIYVITGADDVFAIDVESGEFLWIYKSGLDPTISTVCCSWTSRGVALGDGKIFIGRLDGQLVAIDLKTGKQVWAVQAERWQDGFTITSAPLYYEGKIITGFSGAEYGVRGRVKAFSATDGALLWTYYTVPAPGEFGSDTWPEDSDVWQRGGATVWQTPAVDPELGLVYFSTSNPAPAFNGANREGDNLFTVSMLAIDVDTGAYRWHFQQVHHDIWDFDASSPVVLFDIDVEGKPRKAIAEAGKSGWVYILDRVTGKPLIGIEEQPVPQDSRQRTAATQPVPKGDAFVPQAMEMPIYGYPFVNEGKIFTPFWKDLLPLRPSSYGGTTWAPSSYDPRQKSLFICGTDVIGLFTGGAVDGLKPQEQLLGGKFIFDSHRTGVFAAIDVTTNRLLWRHRWEDFCYSGSAATAGDLVFTGQNDGRFVALDSRDGSVLWEFQTGAGVNAPPAVFEHKGEQYVVVYAAGALLTNSPPGDNVWLFSLSGTLDEVAPGSSAATTTALEVDAAGGAETYARYCSQCHGNKGEGGHGGGPALTGPLDPNKVMLMIARGSEKMPGFGSALTFDQLQQVAAYVRAGLKQQ